MGVERLGGQEVFNAWCDSRGVDGFLLDLDDNLIDTNKPIKKQIYEFVKKCSTNSRIPHDVLLEKFTKINNGLYPTYRVQELKWVVAAQELDDYFGQDGRFVSEASVLLEIFDSVPEFLDGALELLDLIENSGKLTALVTHAPEDWTWLKINGLGLDKYFGEHNVVIVDPKISKAKEHWQLGAHKINVSPARTLAMGDNLMGDILAAKEIGVPNLVLLPAPWSVYADGFVPDNVIQVASPRALIDYILSSA